jgi:hypothetical protein
MRRRSSTRTRLERLEAAVSTTATQPYREAFIEMLALGATERHLVRLSDPGAARCYFQELPGPGPQLADFGDFIWVLHLTTAEMNA